MSTLEQIQKDIAILVDGTTTIATGDDYTIRTWIANKVIEDLYNSYDWPHIAKTATLTLTPSTKTASVTVSDLRQNGVIDLRQDGGNGFAVISYTDFQDSSGYTAYQEGNKIVTNQPSKTSLVCHYIPTPTPLADNADTVDFPSMLVAAGAVRRLKFIEDPEELAPIQKAEEIFKEELNIFMALQKRNQRRIFPSKAWS